MNRQVKGWYVCCTLACLAILSIPFVWRTPAAMLVMCGLPCGGLVGLVGMVIWLTRTRIGYKPVVAGILAMAASFGGASAIDNWARERLFWLNYRAYQKMAKSVVNLSPQKGGEYLDGDYLQGIGVRSAKCEIVKGQMILTIHTASGPSLETVEFSPQRIEAGPRRLIRQDNLGYWYLAN